MPSYAYRVHPALTGLVNSCVGFDFVMPEHVIHHGMPSPGVTVIISFDDPLDAGLGAAPPERWWTLIAGIHLQPAVIRTHGVQRGIQLSLSPAGCLALFGMPAAAVAGTMAATFDLAGALPASLHARLHDATWPRRMALLEDHLLSRAAAAPGKPLAPEMDRAWQLMLRSRGRTTVAALADEVGWSRRHLGSRFRAEFGLGPKELSRVARFDHARALINHRMPLATAAAVAGYADQAHLTREWRVLAGQTPTQTREESVHFADD